MSRLSSRKLAFRGLWFLQWHVDDVKIRPQTMGFVASAAPLVVSPKRRSDVFCSQSSNLSRVLQNKFYQPAQGDSVSLSFALEQPTGQPLKLIKR